MINNGTTSKNKKTSNNLKKQISIDGKQIFKSKEVLNRLVINGENNNPVVRLKNLPRNKSNLLPR